MATVMVEAPVSLMSSLERASHAVDEPLPEIRQPNEPEPRRMYQLLGLVAERGSSGVVDKVIISDKSIGELVALLNPNAYQSITQVGPSG